MPIKHRKEDIVYLAGILDGEGCFSIARCRTSYVPRILVLNTNIKLVRWLKRTFGGDVYKSRVSSNPTWKPRYMWRLSHARALELAEKVWFYLKLKTKLAGYFVVWSVVQELYKPYERKPWYRTLQSLIRQANRKGVRLALDAQAS